MVTLADAVCGPVEFLEQLLPRDRAAMLRASCTAVLQEAGERLAARPAEAQQLPDAEGEEIVLRASVVCFEAIARECRNDVKRRSARAGGERNS